MELDLRALLVAAGVTGEKVSWVERPASDGLPAIVLQGAGSPRSYTLSGATQTQQSRVQADVFASSYPELLATKAALIGAVEAGGVAGATRFSRATVNIDQDMPDETLSGGGRAFRRMVDFSVWHHPA